MSKRRENVPCGAIFTDNAYEVVNDHDIDIVCECVGGAGTDKTYEYLKAAAENGKAVVMSSKKVLALHGPKLMSLIVEKGIPFRYDATVGGGIPVAKIIRECFKGESITRIMGILNATSNYIYTKMGRDGLSFDEALKKAQQLGYAENDPSEDINGYDAMYKAVVLMMFGMGIWLDVKALKTHPFSDINVLDMEYAQELGYSIKPLVIAEKKGNMTVYCIGPCLIGESHIAANTFDNYNVVVFEGSNTGTLGFYGQGAGSSPTASAMFDDLVSILKEGSGKATEADSRRLFSGIRQAEYYEEYTSNLYLRITVDNITGMFASIATVLADNNVNIEKIIQKDEINGRIGIVLLTSRIDKITLEKIKEAFRGRNIEINAIMPFV